MNIGQVVRLAYAGVLIRALLSVVASLVIVCVNIFVVWYWQSWFRLEAFLWTALIWCGLFMLLFGVPRALWRAIVLHRRAACQQCLVCSHDVTGRGPCDVCHAEYGQVDAPLPVEPIGQDWESVAGRGVRWTGRAGVAAGILLILIIVGGVLLSGWWPGASHYAEDGWQWTKFGVLVWGLGFCMMAVFASRGLVLLLESDRRRCGFHDRLRRRKRQQWAVALGVICPLLVGLGLFLGRSRTYHDGPDHVFDLLSLVGGIVLVFPMWWMLWRVFERMMKLGPDRAYGTRALRRFRQMVAAGVFCMVFCVAALWLGAVDAGGGDAMWGVLWWVSLGLGLLASAEMGLQALGLLREVDSQAGWGDRSLGGRLKAVVRGSRAGVARA